MELDRSHLGEGDDTGVSASPRGLILSMFRIFEALLAHIPNMSGENGMYSPEEMER
jgi:hypothetical protein